MRLTLRTLLAFLDDILEPEDAEDINKRVQESEVASALLHRVRDVMRRLRLQAPRVEEASKGLDANTVAEYLDHVLPDDRVPDFERICLESDMHLAEVASCHQILALVLGEPAEVDPQSREHMYAIPQVAADLASMEAREADTTGEVSAPGTPPPPPPRRPRPVVPDYLRESNRRRRPYAVPVAVVVLMIVLLGGWFAGTQFGWWGGGEPESVAVKPGEEKQTPPTEPEKKGPSQPEQGDELVPLDDQGEPAKPEAPPTTEPVPPAVEPEGGEPVEATPAVTEPAPPTPATPEAVDQGPTAPEPNDKLPELPVLPPELEPGAAKAAPEPAAPQGMGSLVSDVSTPETQLLLQFDGEKNEWNRVPPPGVVVANHRFLALPAFRPVIALNSGLTLHLKGGTQIDLRTTEAAGTPDLTLDFGRMEVRTMGKPDTRLHLVAGGRKGTLVFVDPESRAAIEMERTLDPGRNPEEHPSTTVVKIYALSGGLIWEADDGAGKKEFKTPAVLTLEPEGSGTVAALQKFPRWIVADSEDRNDRRATKPLLEGIGVDRPMVLTLKEQLGHRMKEVSWLASRCLGYLGDFTPLAEKLNEPPSQLKWKDHRDYIEKLREAMARGPEAAAQVRGALEGLYGPDAATIYRMLWGYDAQQLIDGADTNLVKGLDHDRLAVRVVSFSNLKKITGGARLYYRPEYDKSARARSIRSWEKRQKAGEIRLKARQDGSAPNGKPGARRSKLKLPPLRPPAPVTP
jgi:hypothetical protein